MGSGKLAGKGTGGAGHQTGYLWVDEGDAGGEGRRASGKRARCSQRWNTGWARPEQGKGGRITEKSTCEEEWKQEEGEGGKEGEEKEVGGWDYGC